jgi:hypothetical protein
MIERHIGELIAPTFRRRGDKLGQPFRPPPLIDPTGDASLAIVVNWH